MNRWIFPLMFPLGLLISVTLQCAILFAVAIEPNLGRQIWWPGIASYFLLLCIPLLLMILAPILAVQIATSESKLKNAIRWNVMWPSLFWVALITVMSFGIGVWLNRTNIKVIGDWQMGFVPLFASYWVSIRGAIRMGNILVHWTHDPNRSVPCIKCGYDLRGQTDCRCPECGAEFTIGKLVSGFRDV